MFERLLSVIECAILTAGTIAAQQSPVRTEFEVASIKPNHSGVLLARTNPVAFTPGGRFTAINVTLVDLIVRVYPTRRIQMEGGPRWMDSDRFDVVAKATDSGYELKYADFVPMVQALIEERFKLKLHRETKSVQVLALTVGKDAPNIQKSKEGEETAVRQGDRGKMSFDGMSIVGLVNTLSNILHTPVVDRTGLSGAFNFTLDPGYASPQTGGDGPLSADSFGDLVIKAVQEQLGFRLERQKAPLEITVIDHVERPTEN